MPFDKPTPWEKGDAFSASHLNEPNPILNSVRSITAGDGTGLLVSQTEGGTTISADPQKGWRDEFLGVITSTGPDSAADYTDARYWVKRVYINSVADENSNVTFEENPPAQAGDGTYTEPFPVTAINLAEVTNATTGVGTHLLGVNGGVWVKVWSQWDRADSPRKHYFFSKEPKYLVKVTGNASGGGKYTGVLMSLNSTSTVPVSGNLAESDMGTALGTSVTILNPPELGQSTHDLTAGTPKSKYFPAIRSPRRASDDTIVFIIAGFDWLDCGA